MIVIFAALLISFIHLIGERIGNHAHKHHEQIISLSAGLFLSFVFLELLEYLSIGYFQEGVEVYLFLLLGFSVFHILNKYVYLHTKDKKHQNKELEEVHFIGFSADMFITGLAIALFLNIDDYFLGLVALIPFILHTVSLTLAVTQLHEKFEIKKHHQWLFSFLPLLGALSAPLFLINLQIFYSTLAFVAGIILYHGTRHMIPRKTHGKIEWYVVGVVVGAMLLMFASA